MTDPLADWWRHQVKVTEFIGSGQFGDEWATPVPHMAAINDQTRKVTDTDGHEVASSTSVVFPIEVGYVRPGSTVTLPAMFGGRTARVIACRVAHGGGQPTPDHVEVMLE